MSFRTDLALEAAESHAGSLPSGISQQERTFGGLHFSTVQITGDNAAALLGKPKGTYITVTAPPLYSAVEIPPEETEEIASEIARLLPDDNCLALVVGLGNTDITPDAIGPRAVHQVLATRHISGEAAAQIGLEGLRPAAALAPGVLGQTGIETSEIIRAVAEDIRPGVIIVIDALAARSAARLGTTVQISDSGISPGSGVMNRRKELSKETLGVPVISIGVPTVVDATTLASDLLNCDEEDSQAARELFRPDGRSMMITPREIDVLISHASRLVAMAVNRALHPDLSLEDLAWLAG